MKHTSQSQRDTTVADEVLSLPEVRGADQLEVVVAQSRVGYTRFANNAVFQDSVVENTDITIRAQLNGTIGSVSTNALETDDIRDAVLGAIAAAKAIGRGSSPGFGDGAAPCPEVDAYDEETASLSLGEKSGTLAPLFDRAKREDVLLAGAYHTHRRSIAIANTRGMRRAHRGTLADVRFNGLAGLRPGDATSYACQLHTSAAAIDLQALGASAIEKVRLGLNPRSIPADRYDVLLEPEAVAELLEWMGFITFASQAMEDGTSLLVDRLGERVTGEAITIVDDGPGVYGYGVPVPFDGEGTPKATLTLIDRGIARSACFDRRAGAELADGSTGHAPIGDAATTAAGGMPTHLMLMPGELSHEELLERLGEGLWVTRFHYVNANLEPLRAVMTGLTRDGTFWVEGGVPQYGVKNLRFTDAIVEAFARVDGLSSTLSSVATWWSELGAVTAPAMIIRGLQFTGTTDE